MAAAEVTETVERVPVVLNTIDLSPARTSTPVAAGCVKVASQRKVKRYEASHNT